MLRRLVPEGLAGARIEPGRRGAAMLLVLALLAAALVGAVTWRSRPDPVEVAPPAPVAVAPAAPVSAGQIGAPAARPGGASATIVVAVAGKVRRPGIRTLPAGSRVADAVRAAGGPLPGVDVGLLNLARRLTDGELVVVGMPGADGSGGVGPSGGTGSPATPGAAGPLDLNAATPEQLDGLPGVGPVLAQRIVDWRAAHGRFDSIDQLREVDGIGDSKFAQLRDRVMV